MHFKNVILKIEFSLNANIFVIVLSWLCNHMRTLHLDFREVLGFVVAGIDWRNLRVSHLDISSIILSACLCFLPSFMVSTSRLLTLERSTLTPDTLVKGKLLLQTLQLSLRFNQINAWKYSNHFMSSVIQDTCGIDLVTNTSKGCTIQNYSHRSLCFTTIWMRIFRMDYQVCM